MGTIQAFIVNLKVTKTPDRPTDNTRIKCLHNTAIKNFRDEIKKIPIEPRFGQQIHIFVLNIVNKIEIEFLKCTATFEINLTSTHFQYKIFPHQVKSETQVVVVNIKHGKNITQSSQQQDRRFYLTVEINNVSLRS